MLGYEPNLTGGRPIRIHKQRRLDQFLACKVCPEFLAGGVAADETHENASRPERSDVARNVSCTANVRFTSLDREHRCRRFRRDARDLAIDEFIEHQVADAQYGLADHDLRQRVKIKHVWLLYRVARSAIAIRLIEKISDIDADCVFKRSEAAIVARGLQPID